LFRSLTTTLADELDVLVIYDRRHGKGWPPPGVPERRTSSGVEERLVADGFAVVRVTSNRAAPPLAPRACVVHLRPRAARPPTGSVPTRCPHLQ